MQRRQLLKGSAGLALLSSMPLSFSAMAGTQFTSQRPVFGERTFTSRIIEQEIARAKAQIIDPELAWMFENCYPNTLDTTVDYEVIDGRPDTFIITGDIDAMWLRDSTAQVWPYMPFITQEKTLQNLVLGLVNRQTTCILKDPYANAFYKDLTKESHWKNDEPSPIDGVHERKWEIDSLCYAVRLAHKYYALTQDTSAFDSRWDQAMRLLVHTLRVEQRKNDQSEYYFKRNRSKATDVPFFFGRGRPIKPVGLISSAFRPSDDAVLYPFLIPSNIFAVISLRQLAEIYANVLNDKEFAKECSDFANEVDTAIQQYAVAEHLHFGKIYAYEVDGFGNKVFMDDANVPSLMSLAYLDPAFKRDPVYQNTRTFLLSDNNPYYLKGKAAEGQASPHTGERGIWPMGIILRAMTSDDPTEIKHCLTMLKNTHAGTGFMHESFDMDDPNKFSRSWFAWANTLFGELIIKVLKEHPNILAHKL